MNTKDKNNETLLEEEYNGVIASLELYSNSKLQEKILDGKKENINDCIDLDEVFF